MGNSYSATKLKVKLKMAVERMNLLTNKKSNAINIARRDIGKLLEQQKDENARIRAEGVLQQQKVLLVFESLSLMCQLLLERVSLIDSAKKCPGDLLETCATVIYSAKRCEVPELTDIAHLLASKFGSSWAKYHQDNQSNMVNRQTAERLTVTPPPLSEVLEFLVQLAGQLGIEWQPTLKDDQNPNQLGSVAKFDVQQAGAVYPGTITVVLHKAKNLYNTQMIGSQNPFVTVQLRDNRVKLRSSASNNPETPHWDDEHFPIGVKTGGQQLLVEVHSKNTIRNAFIGGVAIDVDRIVAAGESSYDKTWWQIGRDSQWKSPAGSVLLSLRYTPVDKPEHKSDDREAPAPNGGGGGGGFNRAQQFEGPVGSDIPPPPPPPPAFNPNTPVQPYQPAPGGYYAPTPNSYAPAPSGYAQVNPGNQPGGGPLPPPPAYSPGPDQVTDPSLPSTADLPTAPTGERGSPAADSPDDALAARFRALKNN